MEIICLLLCMLSLTTARVHPRTGVNDVFDGVEGVLYDIPEYEDPEVSLFKLIAEGIMPVYTVRDVFKDSKGLLNKDDKPRYQTDDIKKGLDAVITQLQEAKNKLENGNNGIYLDIDKSILSLENLKHHLYLDLLTPIASGKHSAMSDIVTEESLDKGSIDKHSILRASLKKYLSSDDSIYKYLSLDIPTDKPSSENSPTVSLNFDSALRPYSPLKSSVQQTTIDDYSVEQSFDSIVPKDENVPLVTERSATPDATTEEPFALGKEVFRYQPLETEILPVEDIYDAKKEKIYVEDDVTSAEPVKIEPNDKTLLRKKWSLKLSSTF